MLSLVKRANKRFATLLGVARVSALLGLIACASSGGSGEIGKSKVAGNHSVQFAFEGIQGGNVTSEALRGLGAALIFVTTFDMTSQAEVNALAKACSGVDKPKKCSQCYVVALEPPESRELVEAYGAALKLPTSLSRVSLVEARQIFGAELAVPTVVILDSLGNIRAIERNPVRPEAIFEALRKAEAH
jgi:hypothetical protein